MKKQEFFEKLNKILGIQDEKQKTVEEEVKNLKKEVKGER